MSKRSEGLSSIVDRIIKELESSLSAQKIPFSASELKRPLTAHLQTKRSISLAQLPKTPEELSKLIDHTLLKAEATENDLLKFCKEAKKYGFASVCINASFVAKARNFLENSPVKPIAVVGFPLGATSTKTKAYEAADATQSGAKEIDMVLHIGALKASDYAFVFQDIHSVVEASKPYPVKVILETALLDQEQKIIACILSKSAGAAFVKTSTGFGPGGATEADISLMRSIVGTDMGVKASGGIRTFSDAMKMLQAGASRIGASTSVAIVKEAAQSGMKPNKCQKSESNDMGSNGGY